MVYLRKEILVGWKEFLFFNFTFQISLVGLLSLVTPKSLQPCPHYRIIACMCDNLLASPWVPNIELKFQMLKIEPISSCHPCPLPCRPVPISVITPPPSCLNQKPKVTKSFKIFLILHPLQCHYFWFHSGLSIPCLDYYNCLLACPIPVYSPQSQTGLSKTKWLSLLSSYHLKLS